MASIFKKVESGIEAVFENEKHSHTHLQHACDHLHPESHSQNRFHSFVAPSSGNVKWFVDGCSYFWAVSEALERALPSLSSSCLSPFPSLLHAITVKSLFCCDLVFRPDRTLKL